MDELIKTFHIDWKLMIAQIINFGIVLFVLWYFALRPLMRTMGKRSADIEESLRNAEEIKKKLADAELTKEEILTKAKQEAQQIVATSAQEADKLRDAKVQQAKQEVETLVAKSKAELEREKQRIIEDAKAAVAGLVVSASERILKQKLDSTADSKLVEDAVKNL